MEELGAAVIGGGVVGLAVAARLAGRGREVALFERHPRHGLETSSRNSEVLHAGLYYPPGSLKARLCLRGRKSFEELGARGGLFVRRTGKLVVAREASELPELSALKARGEANGVEGLRLVEAAEAARMAPGVLAAGALWSPETGILDTEQAMLYFLGKAQDGGALLVWGAELQAAQPSLGGGYELRCRGQEPVRARVVVNAAGLWADRVAALAGLDCDALGYRQHFYKGEYFSLKRPLPIEPLVYPLPGRAGLGIHLTVDRQGRHRLGPNAFAVAPGSGGGLDYSVEPGHAAAFLEAARRFLPSLKATDLVPGTSGVRPRLAQDGSARDFLIAEEAPRGLPGWVNLLGIDSPGFTAAPAIADFVADVLEWPA